MARKDAEFEGFLRGLETARKIVAETEGENSPMARTLQHAILMRRSTGITLGCTQKELNAASEAMKAYTIQTVLAMTLLILYEQNGFGIKRLSRFMNEFNLHTEGLITGDFDWIDVRDCLKAECGLDIALPKEFTQQRVLA